MVDKTCKFCKKYIDKGGIIFTDYDGVHSKACWDDECQTKYKWELERIESREKRALQVTGKCSFKQLDGFCEASAITGEYYCKDHLIERCGICGIQATRYCPKSNWATCDSSLCDAHNHTHQYYH